MHEMLKSQRYLLAFSGIQCGPCQGREGEGVSGRLGGLHPKAVLKVRLW